MPSLPPLSAAGVQIPGAEEEPSPSPTIDVPPPEDIAQNLVDHIVSGDWWLDTALPTVLKIAVIIIGALVTRWLLGKAVDRTVNRMIENRQHKMENQWAGETARIIEGERGIQRAETVRVLFKNVISIVVFGVMIMFVIAEMGVNIGPLLAGAGVLGLALGFGAQSLVADFFNGVFMTLEDQLGVGDVVDLGEAVGTVEAVSLRITQVRSIDGTLWFVRNGEVMRVGNMSQDWSRTILDIGIAYRNDVNKARDIMNKVGARMYSDPDYASKLLQPPEVWGVQDLSNDSVVVRIVVKTRPGEQWSCSRELRERIKYAFDEGGIEIPFPQRTLWLRDDNARSAPGQDSPLRAGVDKHGGEPEADSPESDGDSGDVD